MQITIGKLANTVRNMDKKEVINAWNLIAFSDGKFRELVTVRWYMSRSSKASVIYCTVWLHNAVFENSHGHWTDASASGQAGGGGYCKQSAAFADAMLQAGIKFDQDISGRGIDVVADGLIALGEFSGYKHIKLVRG